MKSFNPSTIDKQLFNDTLARYDGHIPEKLTELEKFRMEELPSILKERGSQSKDGNWMEKEELIKLVEWKLKHGTFRPKLLQLVSSNSQREIRSLTKLVFTNYSSSPTPDRPALVKQLTQLKGIGPATASLILSAIDPNRAIFFGDEVFRWLSWDETPKGPKGWSRRIGYNLSEYRQLDQLAEYIVKRLEAKAIEVEMVGYVLGKEAVDVDAQRMKGVATKVEEKETGGGVKRKSQTQEAESVGRKSKRHASSGS